MRFLFFILFLASFTASANPDISQFTVMEQELEYILAQIEQREQIGEQDTTYVYMRKGYKEQLAKTGKNKVLITDAAIKEANRYLFQLDTMGRKTIIYFGYAMYSEKVARKKGLDAFVKKMYADLFKQSRYSGDVNVLVNLLVYSQKAGDAREEYSFNVYFDNLRQSYKLEEGLSNVIYAQINKENIGTKKNKMSNDPNMGLTFRAKLLFDKIKGWKKFTGLLNAGMLKTAFNGGNQGFIVAAAPLLDKYMKTFEINTPCRIAHFLAQVGVEVNGFKNESSLKEDLNYSKCNIKYNLCQKCYSFKDGDSPKCPTDTSDCSPYYSGERLKMCKNPKNYAGDDEKIALAAYDGFMGRGFIHLTWKENYLKVYNYCVQKGLNPKNFVTDPKLVSNDFEVAAMSACAFFALKGCLSEADQDDFDGVMNIVNASDTNKDKKRNLLAAMKKQFKICE